MNDVDELLKIMDRLRDPQSGCPWDLQQTNASILPHTIEEVYELAEAINATDSVATRDELGDLLFQIMFYSRLANEAGQFDFSEVVKNISDKLVRRHPHVFGDTIISSAAEQTLSWEQIKQQEREAAGQGNTALLDSVSNVMPALMCAAKLQTKAATVGFDWDQPQPVVDKIREELDELYEVMEADEGEARCREEVGDLLFACANLARHLKVDPETALMGANRKFRQRFGYIESQLAGQGRRLEDADLEEMEALWQEAKSVRGESEE